MCLYKYEFKKNSLRESIDLSGHKQAIEDGLRETFLCVTNIKVHKNLFEFKLPEEATDGGKRKMGKCIIRQSDALGSMVKEYIYKNSDDSHGRSGQLFRAKKE